MVSYWKGHSLRGNILFIYLFLSKETKLWSCTERYDNHVIYVSFLVHRTSSITCLPWNFTPEVRGRGDRDLGSWFSYYFCTANFPHVSPVCSQMKLCSQMRVTQYFWKINTSCLAQRWVSSHVELGRNLRSILTFKRPRAIWQGT